jgi:hypothetical protein
VQFLLICGFINYSQYTQKLKTTLKNLFNIIKKFNNMNKYLTMWIMWYIKISFQTILTFHIEHSDGKKKPLHFILGFDNNTVILKKS